MSKIEPMSLEDFHQNFIRRRRPVPGLPVPLPQPRHKRPRHPWPALAMCVSAIIGLGVPVAGISLALSSALAWMRALGAPSACGVETKF